MSDDSGSGSRSRSFVVLLLRLYLGLALFLPLGIGKLVAYPGSSAGMVERFADTILGQWPLLPALYLFSYVLPWWETLGGAALTLGVRTRLAFGALGVLLVLLGFGSTLEMNIATTGRNFLFLAGCCWGWYWSDADRYGVDGWRSGG